MINPSIYIFEKCLFDNFQLPTFMISAPNTTIILLDFGTAPTVLCFWLYKIDLLPHSSDIACFDKYAN